VSNPVPVKVEGIPTRSPNPLLITAGLLGPADEATVNRDVMFTPDYPVRVTKVRVIPSSTLAANANSTTFTLRTSAGVVIATGTDVAEITAAAGLVLTIDAATAARPINEHLLFRAANVASGTNMSAITLTIQVEYQPGN